MNKWAKGTLWLLGGILLGVVAAYAAMHFRPRGPFYMGMSVDKLIDEMGNGTNGALCELAFKQLGASAVPRLIEIMEHQETPLERKLFPLEQRFNPRKEPAGIRRWHAAWACSMIGAQAEAAMPALTKLLQSHQYFGEIVNDMIKVSPSAIPLITNELRDPDPHVREIVASSLRSGSLSPAVAADGLIIATRDTDPEVRASAVWSLGVLGASPDKAIPVLINALHDPEGKVRGLAANALGLFGTAAKPAVPAMVEFIRTDVTNSGMAADALMKIDPEAYPRARWPFPEIRQAGENLNSGATPSKN